MKLLLGLVVTLEQLRCPCFFKISYQYVQDHTAWVSQNSADAGLVALIAAAASRRRAGWHIPTSARQQPV